MFEKFELGKHARSKLSSKTNTSIFLSKEKRLAINAAGYDGYVYTVRLSDEDCARKYKITELNGESFADCIEVYKVDNLQILKNERVQQDRR